MAIHASECLRLVTTLSRIATILLETLVAMVTSLGGWVQHRQLKLLRVTTGEGSFTELVLQGVLRFLVICLWFLASVIVVKYEKPIIVSIDLGYQNA
ncbi:hypothetical protein M422DRAFT_268867 [Sphaerobolus stellatus SS14]|uniref:Uncharacterized protein n=1 Tax=Sphaerobolus stellatus (strain SS14) TaxID=990650 RepID=A0A0C9TJC9_SPHS4|nr:hypothetical protein M422DRAFT_268867 [Sphaerobolus stellatus SS14]